MTMRCFALGGRTSAKAASQVRVPKGGIEKIPLRTTPSVIISQLRDQSIRRKTAYFEAFRVLKPGGGRARVPTSSCAGGAARDPAQMELWIGCIAGRARTTTSGKLAPGRIEGELEPTGSTAARARASLRAKGSRPTRSLRGSMEIRELRPGAQEGG